MINDALFYFEDLDDPLRVEFQLFARTLDPHAVEETCRCTSLHFSQNNLQVKTGFSARK